MGKCCSGDEEERPQTRMVIQCSDVTVGEVMEAFQAAFSKVSNHVNSGGRISEGQSRFQEMHCPDMIWHKLPGQMAERSSKCSTAKVLYQFIPSYHTCQRNHNSTHLQRY